MTQVNPFEGSAGAADAAGVAAPTDTQVVVLTDAEIDAIAGAHLLTTPPGNLPHWGWFYASRDVTVGFPWSVNVPIREDWHVGCGLQRCFGPYASYY